MKHRGLSATLLLFLANLAIFAVSATVIIAGPNQTFASSIYNDGVSSRERITTQDQAEVGLPVRLRIPKIKVDSALESVGLTKDGAVGVPKGRKNAAWFNLGPRPGAIGSAIIDGHFGWWKNGTPAIFNNLHKLRKGDRLYIEDENGLIVTFVVRESRTYKKDENVPAVFTAADDTAHLNLITCGGVWNIFKNNYPNRLVVFTDKEII